MIKKHYRRAINGYHLEGEVPTKKRLAMVPIFIREGYAIFKDNVDFEAVMSEGFNFVGNISIRDDAPSWLVDEYECICKFFTDSKVDNSHEKTKNSNNPAIRTLSGSKVFNE